MLTRIIKKKSFLIISSIILILIVYLFPTKKEETSINNEKSESNTSIIYLLDQNNYIARVSVIMANKTSEKQIYELIEYLTEGSSKNSTLKEGFAPIIPKNTKLLSIKTENDLVKLNFSKQFLTIDEEKEDKLISSLVYTLTSLENINKISIYIEGNILNKMLSGKQIPTIIDRSYGINQKYNITNIKGSTKTTIYYLSKFKDYYYYVPFTMVNNENKEKIEIIIEELASKNVYETSLISYLKDTKEISYEIENNFISLNMSKKLFNDLYESNLIESVIYTINLSVKENYTQKEVIYNIDNQLYKNYYI
ncbi:MAG: GerMN domain-containing protein [bacterium]|nr:GerMN domain-containing protein [bacterium]